MTIDHLVFYVKELERTEHFYRTLCGEPQHRSSEEIIFQLGETKLFFAPSDIPRIAERDAVGFNHLAFVVTRDKLDEYVQLLDQAGIEHSGIVKDQHSSNDMIWLNDPDDIRVELYARK